MIKGLAIAVQSYDRYDYLCLMRYYLRDIWDDIVIFDDGSIDSRIDKNFELFYKADVHSTLPESEANSRCGAQRKRIVDWFLSTDKEYLMLLDDDIIIDSNTISEGLSDLKSIEDMEGIGIYSFHTWMKDYHRVQINNLMYGFFSLTGESCSIIPRYMLEDVGNYFSGDRFGYLDIQAKMMRDKGYHIVCRLNNPHRVQHIGLIDSHIHPKNNLKYWHRDLWHSYESREYLRPDNFNPDVYIKLIKEHGPKGAPRKYLTILEEKDKMSGQNAVSKFERPRGVVEITTLEGAKIKNVPKIVDINGMTRQVLENPGKVICVETVRNMVVDQAFYNFSRLLAGHELDSRHVTHMQWGTGATAPAAADTVLEAGITPVKEIASYSFPTDRSVQFVAYLDSTEGNGFAIQECGLLADDTIVQRLIARVTFGVHAKSNNFVYQFKWTIYWQ